MYYEINHNIAGYLPESDPRYAETPEGALADLADLIDEHLDADHPNGYDDGESEWPDQNFAESEIRSYRDQSAEAYGDAVSVLNTRDGVYETAFDQGRALPIVYFVRRHDGEMPEDES